MVRVDFHTHSVNSPDGSITAAQYRQVLDNGVLDCIAITDHNEIDFALELERELGSNKIIVGEEITTVSGEIIGLFLHERIEPYQTVENTIQAIRDQGGVVYIPHPLEKVRKGLRQNMLDSIISDIDVIESANGRAFFQNKGPKILPWAKRHRLATAASSDAHHAPALGKTYTVLSEVPTTKTLVTLLAKSAKQYKRPSARDLLAPKRSRLKKISRKLTK